MLFSSLLADASKHIFNSLFVALIETVGSFYFPALFSSGCCLEVIRNFLDSFVCLFFHCLTSFWGTWPAYCLSSLLPVRIPICYNCSHLWSRFPSCRREDHHCNRMFYMFYLPSVFLLGHHLGLVLTVISVECLSVLQINVSAGQLTCSLTSGCLQYQWLGLPFISWNSVFSHSLHFGAIFDLPPFCLIHRRYHNPQPFLSYLL